MVSKPIHKGKEKGGMKTMQKACILTFSRYTFFLLFQLLGGVDS